MWEILEKPLQIYNIVNECVGSYVVVSFKDSGSAEGRLVKVDWLRFGLTWPDSDVIMNFWLSDIENIRRIEG